MLEPILTDNAKEYLPKQEMIQLRRDIDVGKYKVPSAKREALTTKIYKATGQIK